MNVPGTILPANWTWRMPVPLEALAADAAWTGAVREALAR